MNLKTLQYILHNYVDYKCRKLIFNYVIIYNSVYQSWLISQIRHRSALMNIVTILLTRMIKYWSFPIVVTQHVGMLSVFSLIVKLNLFFIDRNIFDILSLASTQSGAPYIRDGVFFQKENIYYLHSRQYTYKDSTNTYIVLFFN